MRKFKLQGDRTSIHSAGALSQEERRKRNNARRKKMNPDQRAEANRTKNARAWLKRAVVGEVA